MKSREPLNFIALATLFLAAAWPQTAFSNGSSGGPDSNAQGQAFLETAATAHGGWSGLTSKDDFAVRFVVDWKNSGQSRSPDAPPRADRLSAIEVLNNRDDWYFYEEDFSAETFHQRIRRVGRGTEENLLRLDHKSVHPVAEAAAGQVRYIARLLPIRFLKEARAGDSTIEWIGEVGPAQRTELSYTDTAGVRKWLAFDTRSKLLTEVRWERTHPVFGDVHRSISFSDLGPGLHF